MCVWIWIWIWIRLNQTLTLLYLYLYLYLYVYLYLYSQLSVSELVYIFVSVFDERETRQVALSPSLPRAHCPMTVGPAPQSQIFIPDQILNQVIGATLQLGGQNVLSPSKTRIRPTPTRARPTKTNYGGVPTPTRKNFGPVVGSALPVERVEVQPPKPATQRGVGKVG